MTHQMDIHKISCSYGDTEILHGVSFSVEKGEFLGIIGPNGSGKTTLLKAITRALSLSQGEITLNSQSIESYTIRELARRIAVVPQETEAFFDFSVRDVVLMGRTPYLGRFQIEGESDLEIAEEALKMTHLKEIADKPITALSGGEKQRVLIARALTQKPEILFLDEPTSHLDINYQLEILELVKSLSKERGITVVAVLHDLNLASEFCERLLLLKGGILQQDGAPSEVITTANIRRIYGTNVIVRKHPITGRPYVISGSFRSPSSLDKGIRVHLLCGGGSGRELMHRLTALGYTVSAGVLNVADSDEEAAQSLGLTVVSEAPFSPISETNYEKNCRLAKTAVIIIVAPSAFGKGNLFNLDTAQEMQKAGKTIIIVGNNFEERDFTSGIATQKLRGMISRGAFVADNIEEIDSVISKALVDKHSSV